MRFLTDRRLELSQGIHFPSEGTHTDGPDNADFDVRRRVNGGNLHGVADDYHFEQDLGNADRRQRQATTGAMAEELFKVRHSYRQCCLVKNTTSTSLMGIASIQESTA